MTKKQWENFLRKTYYRVKHPLSFLSKPNSSRIVRTIFILENVLKPTWFDFECSGRGDLVFNFHHNCFNVDLYCDHPSLRKSYTIQVPFKSYKEAAECLCSQQPFQRIEKIKNRLVLKV